MHRDTASDSSGAETRPVDRLLVSRLAALGLADSRLATCFVDGMGTLLAANSAMAILTGYPVDALVGRSYTELLAPEERSMVDESQLSWTNAEGPPSVSEQVYIRADGSTFVVRVHITELANMSSSGSGFLLQIDDITEERAMRAEVAASQAQLAAVVDASVDAIVVIDQTGTLLRANPATCEMFGWDAPSLIGQNVTMLLPPDMRPLHEAGLQRYLQTGSGRIVDSHGVEVDGLHRDGTLVPVELTVREIMVGSGRRFTGAMRDLRPRRELVQRLRGLAYEDSLTGLPNAAALVEHLRSVVEDDRPHSLLVCDVDGLASINDSFGPAVGDALLVELAARIRRVCGPEPFLGRYRSAEMVLICADPDPALANRIVDGCDTPFDVAGRHVTASLSIGVVALDEVNADISGPRPRSEAALQRGESALGAAKLQGRASIRTFDAALANAVQQRAEVEQQLRVALSQDALDVHYQPIVAVPQVAGRAVVERSRWVGLETLARWRLPDGEMVPPAVFIPIAESAGLIGSLGRLVLDKAVRQGRLWLDELAERAPRLNVNVSPLQLMEGDFVADVARTLDRHDFPAQLLVLELTESSAVLPGGFRILEKLQDLGVTLAVDDFGTEWSGLVRLSHQPFQELKVDRSFVVAAAARPRDAALLEGVLDLARRLDMATIVEGVETPDQLDLVVSLGARVVQGYLLSLPLPAEDLHEELLRRSDGRVAMTPPPSSA